MRTIALLASVFALTVVSAACTTETAAPTSTASNKPKKGKTSKPGSENQNGEHGDNTPAGSTPGAEEVPDGDAIAAGTWETGKTITTSGFIAEGETVTIAPGATVNVADGVQITVKGTLKVAAGANHAKLTGAAWKGIQVDDGGKLEADGLEISGAETGILARAGSTSTFKNGVLSAKSPFTMEAGSSLTVDHSKVTATQSGSGIAGTFVANYMDYDKGTFGGLTLNDAEGTMTIKNSTLHGGGGGDYVISNKGKNVTVQRTSISGSHCALHFSGDGPTSFLIDGVDIKDNGVGGMLYNSGAGPNDVKNTNFAASKEYDISFGSNGNGKITFTNVFGTIPKAENVTLADEPGNPLSPDTIGPVKE